MQPLALSRYCCTALLAVGLCVRASSGAAPPPEAINLRRTVTVEVVQKTKDAVVYISTTRFIAQRRSPFGDPFFREFLGGGGGDEVVRVPANSLGSGFIIHSDGYVVTNHHVIDRARQIDVELADGRKLPAELISSDPEADLAVLRVKSDKPLPALALGDSGDLMIGEPVIAVGNPLGYSHSVSTGIVSALHRDLKSPGEKVGLGDLIQTDAAINPGNSGGPLLNAYGQVIGINTAIRGDAQNIGFSIPVNRLRDLLPELMNPAHGKKLDVHVKLREERSSAPPAEVHSRVLIGEGKSARVVTSINGWAPHDIVDACAALLRLEAGQTCEIRCEGAKDPIREQVTAVPLPDAIRRAKDRLGLTIEPLTPLLAEQYGVQADDGLLVKGVGRGSVAAKAGIEPGDVIVQIGRYRVETLDDFAALLGRLPASGRVRVGVVRDGQLGVGVLDLGS